MIRKTEAESGAARPKIKKQNAADDMHRIVDRIGMKYGRIRFSNNGIGNESKKTYGNKNNSDDN